MAIIKCNKCGANIVSPDRRAPCGICGSNKAKQRRPWWFFIIRTVKSNRDIGVGDTIDRLLAIVGGRHYKSLYERVFGKGCGCKRRQTRLNAMFPYKATKDTS